MEVVAENLRDRKLRLHYTVKGLAKLREAVDLSLSMGKILSDHDYQALTQLSGSHNFDAQINALDECEEAAEEELLKVWAELARNSYHDFYEYMQREEGFIMSPHQRLIGDLLMESESGETKRFLLSMPPGHSKSTHASHHFPAWFFGRNPKKRFLQAGHTQGFVENEIGAKVRGILDSDDYRRVFSDIKIRSDMRAKANWGLTNKKGQYLGKGVGQGISGVRGHYGMVDDPFASRADAESPTTRDHTYVWFADDFSTRLLPGSPLGIVATRWHSDDVCGRITERERREAEQLFHAQQKVLVEQNAQATGNRAKYKYKIINLPAIAEDDDILGRKPGEPLWPELFDLDALAILRAEMTPSSWNSLYQGTPMDITGGAVKASWFKRYERLPSKAGEHGRTEIRRVVLSVDAANTAKERSDYTVITVWIEDLHRQHYLADVYREKVEFNDLCVAIDNLVARWQNIAGEVTAVLVEPKGNGLSYVQLKGASTGAAPIIAIEVGTNSKEFRFDKVTPMFEAGQVFLPERSIWLADYEKELLGFPLAKHDDQVDSTSQYLEWSRTKSRRGTKKMTGSGYDR